MKHDLVELTSLSVVRCCVSSGEIVTEPLRDVIVSGPWNERGSEIVVDPLYAWVVRRNGGRAALVSPWVCCKYIGQ